MSLIRHSKFVLYVSSFHSSHQGISIRRRSYEIRELSVDRDGEFSLFFYSGLAELSKERTYRDLGWLSDDSGPHLGDSDLTSSDKPEKVCCRLTDVSYKLSTSSKPE